ncbi:hypothetical protein NDU88_005538 [Pleurodeles waltl]|uniref:Uncharacterized protein n=1 Tax=Pleurodeles waltl TaxID=8319 RepID=A0AAV7NMQ2_PLEWA|nr:hypothetical protein NDU88_005538 [Pleurodeles waltl]
MRSRARAAPHFSLRLRGSLEAAFTPASPDAAAVARVPLLRHPGGPLSPPAGRPRRGWKKTRNVPRQFYMLKRMVTVESRLTLFRFPDVRAPSTLAGL